MWFQECPNCSHSHELNAICPLCLIESDFISEHNDDSFFTMMCTNEDCKIMTFIYEVSV